MYDSHIYCKEYHGLKQTIIDILNGDDVTTDIEKLSDHIQQLYDDGEMQATQYDDLMSYIQDMCWYTVNTDIISVFKTGKPFTVIFLKSNPPAFLL